MVIALCFSLLPIRISATEVEDSLPNAKQTTDVEILSGKTADKRGDELYSTATSGSSLSGLNRKIYDLLKADVERVAVEGGNTQFRYSLEELGIADLSWTAQELNVLPIVGSDKKLSQDTWNQLGVAIQQKLGYSYNACQNLWKYLRADCPYEMYWAGIQTQEEYVSTNGNAVPLFDFVFNQEDESGWMYASYDVTNPPLADNLVVRVHPDAYVKAWMRVEEYYAKKNAERSTYYHYEVDPAFSANAVKASENARKIVAENAGKSDYEKLKAYKDAICQRVSYNYDAAQRSVKEVGADPHNLIYVFDDDPNTNVVCEGYAKAFQYLCDLSSFREDVVSYLMIGNLTGNGIAVLGLHAWNHVEINGRMWLVDITNCDKDTPIDDLFLKAPIEQSIINGKPMYRFRYENGYVHYSDIENYYQHGSGEKIDILLLDNLDYQPGLYRYIKSVVGFNNSVTHLSFPAGSEVSFTSASHSDYVFREWSGLEGLSITKGNANTREVTFIMPDRSLEIRSEFNPLPKYNLSVTTLLNGEVVSTHESTAIPANAPISFPSQNLREHGMFFIGWSGIEGIDLVEGTPQTEAIQFLMPNRDLQITASVWYFEDIRGDTYYYEPVVWAFLAGVTKGTSGKTFSPLSTCTRGQVATFLWRANGSPEPKTSRNPFEDVSSSSAFYKAILWAYENGITTGTSETTFSPSNPCTRAHVLTFLWRAKGMPTPSEITPLAEYYPDRFFSDALAWADSQSLLWTYEGAEFEPSDACPRADIVTYLYRDLAG